MTKEELIRAIEDFVETDGRNYVAAEDAISPELAGLRMYEAPLLGFAAAEDTLFTEEFKREGVISPDYLSPREWLPGAKTVISVFLPFTKEVRDSNREKFDVPYAEGIPQRAGAAWLHARVEGQTFVDALAAHLLQLLTEAGYETVSPSIDKGFRMLGPYLSVWSERHAAYAAGLGTFGLSKGLITEKGMAGRICSVITTAELEPTTRPYSDPFEYCNLCGACMKRCPVNAIDKARGYALGKDQNICGPYVNGGKLPPHGPRQVVRYGCGKCQVGVPCEHGIPGRGKAE